MERTEIKGLRFVIEKNIADNPVFAKRDDLKAFLSEQGATLSNNLTSKTDYYVTDHPNAVSEIAYKAKELGIDTISWLDFFVLSGIMNNAKKQTPFEQVENYKREIFNLLCPQLHSKNLSNKKLYVTITTSVYFASSTAK